MYEGDLQEAGSDRLAVFPVMIACEFHGNCYGTTSASTHIDCYHHRNYLVIRISQCLTFKVNCG